jgi:hypothetical protein
VRFLDSAAFHLDRRSGADRFPAVIAALAAAEIMTALGPRPTDRRDDK